MDYGRILKKTGVGATKALLLALFAGAVIMTPAGVGATLQMACELFEGKEAGDYDEEKIKRALRYLRSRRLIDIQRSYQKDVFRLTKLGKRRVKKLLKSFGIRKSKKWDGKWRIVVFDVPETRKDKRDLFRQQLRSLGLANIQKSIWAHPYECRDQIFYLAGNLFIKPYVRYIVADEITGEKDLRRRFGI